MREIEEEREKEGGREIKISNKLVFSLTINPSTEKIKILNRPCSKVNKSTRVKVTVIFAYFRFSLSFFSVLLQQSRSVSLFSKQHNF
jgi:hypothetical protein